MFCKAALIPIDRPMQNFKARSKKQEARNWKQNTQLIRNRTNFTGQTELLREFLRLNLMGDGFNPCSLKVLLYVTFIRVDGRRGV